MTEDKTIPEFTSYTEMAEFWDTHDLADYWEAIPTEIILKIKQKFAEFILKPDKMDQVLADIQ
jgi:hypothetical protein